MNVPPESSGGDAAPVAHPLGQTPGLGGDGAERLEVGVEDRRHDERSIGGDGDADVDARVELEAAVAVGAVRQRMLAQRERRGLDDQVVERRGDLAPTP